MDLTSVSSISAPTYVAPTPTTSTIAAPATSEPATDTRFSKMGQLMSQLQSLQQSDPAKAKQVLTNIASSLQSTAPDAAAKFNQAAQTGDLSALQPKHGHGGGHHHHHGGGGGAPATGAAAYQQSQLDDIESTISAALSS
jgi:hypothetical protein